MTHFSPASGALLLLIASCAGRPPVTSLSGVTPPPERWSTPTAAEPGLRAPSGQDWWESFRDPSLSDMIHEALGTNFDILVAEARVRRAASEARIARADLLPAAGASVDASRRRQNFIGLPIPGGEGGVLSTTTDSFGASLDVIWEADLWGRLRAGARASVADAQAAAADYEAARLSIAGQVARAWFALAELQQQVILAERTVATRQQTADQVRLRYERGLRAPLELRLALSDLAGAESLLRQRRRQRDGALRQCEILLGRHPGARMVPPEKQDELPPPVPAGLPAELLNRRPDILAAERRLAAADERLSVARRSLYPRLVLTGRGGTASNELRDLLDGDFRIWSLIAGLTQPIFQGGRLRAGVDRGAAMVDEAAALYRDTVLSAMSEVESALAAESLLIEQEARAREASHHARAAERLAMDRYAQGLTDYITVLETQRRALLEEGAWITARRTLLDNRVNLHLALGGGFHSPRAPSGEAGPEPGRSVRSPGPDEGES